MGWQYVVPQTTQPGKLVLFHWPPVDGEVMILCYDGAVLSAPIGEDGVLKNPRTGETVAKPAEDP